MNNKTEKSTLLNNLNIQGYNHLVLNAWYYLKGTTKEK